MSEKRKHNPNSRPNYALRRILALVALAGTVGAAAGLTAALTGKGKEPLFVPGTEYVVKSGDNPWSIAQKAGLDMDTREAVDRMDASLPHDDFHAGGTIHPGEKVVFSGHPKGLQGKSVLVRSTIKGELPAVVPTFPGTTQPAGYGSIYEDTSHGKTYITAGPGSPP